MDTELAKVFIRFKHLSTAELVNGLRMAAFIVAVVTGMDGIAILRAGRKAFVTAGLHSVGQHVACLIKAELWADD